MITLFATLVQIPIRVVISYALFGRLGIQAVAIGTTLDGLVWWYLSF